MCQQHANNQSAASVCQLCCAAFHRNRNNVWKDRSDSGNSDDLEWPSHSLAVDHETCWLCRCHVTLCVVICFMFVDVIESCCELALKPSCRRTCLRVRLPRWSNVVYEYAWRICAIKLTINSALIHCDWVRSFVWLFSTNSKFCFVLNAFVNSCHRLPPNIYLLTYLLSNLRHVRACV